MKFEAVPLSEAKGEIMGHDVAGSDGRRLLRKGKPLTEDDLENLRALGRKSVYVAQFEEDDVDENTAARRVAEAVCGPGSSVTRTNFVALDDEADEAALAEMLSQQIAAGIRLILFAGETAIMDAQDIDPRAVERAGGHVESVGAPVDPGNLFMLAYLNDVPVVGAPGCARSKKVNIVDWILPRLLAGDRLTRRDIIKMGHGGLLQDVPERGTPRDIKDGSLDETDPEPSPAFISSGG